MIMEELKTTEYNRFKGGIRSQYKNLLVEKEMQLKNIEEHNQKLHDKICRKCAEYDMFCDLYGAVSQKADDVSVEIKKLIQEYDEKVDKIKIEELKKEIEWLKSNIEE
jgi:hypothetical protein